MSLDDGSQIFAFETTHNAMWAEDVAREQTLPVEVVPAPPHTKSMCGLALRIARAEADKLAAALDQEGIEYTVIP